MENSPKINISKEVQDKIKPETKEFRDDLAEGLKTLRENDQSETAERFLKMEQEATMKNREYGFAKDDIKKARNNAIGEKRYQEMLSKHKIEDVILELASKGEHLFHVLQRKELRNPDWNVLIPKLVKANIEFETWNLGIPVETLDKESKWHFDKLKLVGRINGKQKEIDKMISDKDFVNQFDHYKQFPKYQNMEGQISKMEQELVGLKEELSSLEEKGF